MNNPRKISRIAGAATLVVCMVAAFAALGGVGQAQNAISAGQSQYGKKVTICHKGKTIKVNKHAVPAHLRHGDTLGPCSNDKKAKHKKHHSKAKHGEHADKAKSDDSKSKAKTDDSKSQSDKGDKPAKGKGHGK